MDKNFEKTKEIFKKFNYNFSDEDISEIEKNISALAEVVVSFEKSKKKKPKDTKPPQKLFIRVD